MKKLAALLACGLIVNSSGETVVTLPRQFDATAFAATGFVDDRIATPLAQLPRGRYLAAFTLESKAQAPMQRQVSFAIR